MTTSSIYNQGRYLLYLDILGFSELVKSEKPELIYSTIDRILRKFIRLEISNGQFKTIYFSDTFLLYQTPRGYGDWAFLDSYAIGAMLHSALLAMGIPTRGVISLGEFESKLDSSNSHQVFFGEALVDAYVAEKRENWIGVAILESAWRPYEVGNPGVIEILAEERVWIRRQDNILLLNPFGKLRRWHQDYLIGELPQPYIEWDAPWFKNDIMGLKFLRDNTLSYAAKGDFSSKTALKYHGTLAFIKRVLGNEIYEWGTTLGCS